MQLEESGVKQAVRFGPLPDGQACRINALTGTPGDAGAPAHLPIRPLCKRTSADAAAFRKAALSRSCCRPTTSRSWSCSWRRRCKTGCAFRAAPGYYGRGMNGLRPPRALPGPPLPCVSVRCVSGHLRMRQPLRKAALSRSCCRPMISPWWSCSWRKRCKTGCAFRAAPGWSGMQDKCPYGHPRRCRGPCTPAHPSAV